MSNKLSWQERAKKYIQPQPNGCLIWIGYKKKGYANLKVDGRAAIVSRLVLADKLGRPIRKGKWALHTCDNCACVASKHIYEGTAKQNTVDRDARGNSVYLRGSAHGAAKLTEIKVRAARLSTKSCSYLAKKHGVSLMTMWNAINRVTWKHVI